MRVLGPSTPLGAAAHLPGRKLYAVAVERLTKDGWVPEGIVYTHGVDQASARFAYLASAHGGPRTRVVAVGPAIGYFCDARGENASAD